MAKTTTIIDITRIISYRIIIFALLLLNITIDLNAMYLPPELSLKQEESMDHIIDIPPTATAIRPLSRMSRIQEILEKNSIFPQVLIECILQYATPTSEEIGKAHDDFKKAMDTETWHLAREAFNNFADINKDARYDGLSCISYLITYGSRQLRAAELEDVLSQGADPNQADNDGAYPLHKVLWTDWIEPLIRYGADITVVDREGRNVLWNTHRPDKNFCYLFDRPCSLLTALIKYGANSNHRNNNHQTPLHDTASRHSVCCVRGLVEANADVHAKDDQGDTPLHYTIRLHPITRNNYRNALETVSFLITSKANPFVKNNHGKAPWEQCTGDSELVNQLLETVFKIKR